MGRTRSIVVVLLGAGVVAAGLIRREEPRPAAAPPPHPWPAMDAPGDAVRVRASLGGLAGREAVAPDAREPRTERGERLVRGTIALTDWTGRVHCAADGVMSAIALPARDRGCDVRVTAGRWDLLVPSDAESIVFNNVRLFGARDELDQGWIRLGDGDDVHLEVTGPPPLTLSVRSAEDGRDLQDVVVFADLAVGPIQEAQRLCRGASSPIDLGALLSDCDLDPASVLVHAPGHASASTNVLAAVGGDVVVTLPPGGDLSVTFTGVVPPSDFWMELECLTAPANRVARWIQRGSEPGVDVPGLEVGRYHVRADVVDRLFHQALGSAEFEVLRGVTTHVVLPLDPIDRTSSVPLRGVVVVPPAVRNGPMMYTSLSARGENAPPFDGGVVVELDEADGSPGPDGSVVYRFDFGAAAPGRYWLSMAAQDQPVDLKPGRDSEIQWTLVDRFDPDEFLIRCGP